METYMKEATCRGRRLISRRSVAEEVLNRYEGKGIPCLVLVDAGGKVISDSYEGEKYLGPAKVMADIETIFAQQAGGQVAQRQ